MRKSVSTCAFHHNGATHHVMPMPTTPIEHIGFNALLKLSHSTACECIANYHAVDFPSELLEIRIDPKDAEKAIDMATCLVTPPDVPERENESVYVRQGTGADSERSRRERSRERKRGSLATG